MTLCDKISTFFDRNYVLTCYTKVGEIAIFTFFCSLKGDVLKLLISMLKAVGQALFSTGLQNPKFIVVEKKVKHLPDDCEKQFVLNL